MRRPKTAQALQDDLHELVETVGPKVESAFHNVAENAQPALAKGRAAAAEKSAQLAENAQPAWAKGRAVAAEKGAQLAESLSERIPDDVVDRLPDAVAERLPKKRRRGRKLLLVGAAVALGGVAYSFLKRNQAPAPEPAPRPVPTPAPAPAPTPAAERTPDPEAAPQADARQGEAPLEAVPDPAVDTPTESAGQHVGEPPAEEERA